MNKLSAGASDVMRALVAVSVLIACGGAQPRPAPPLSNKPVAGSTPRRATAPTEPGSDSVRLDRLMRDTVGMVDAMGAAVDRIPDCAKLADALDRVLTDSAGVIARWRSFDTPELRQQRDAAMSSTYQELIMPGAMKLAGAGQRCSSEPKFTAFMERLSRAFE